MSPFHLSLLVAALLCSLLSGLVLTFAIVVMPGIRTLNDGDFLRAFQVMDRVIQNNQPLFMLVWVGSGIALLTTALLGFGQLEGVERIALTGAVAIYLLGVQLPTISINVPLNNGVQALQIESMDPSAQATARQTFEARWTQWNSIRTALATLVSVVLLALLLRA